MTKRVNERENEKTKKRCPAQPHPTSDPPKPA